MLKRIILVIYDDIGLFLVAYLFDKKGKRCLDNENQDDGLIKRAFEKFDADDDGIIAIVDVVKLINHKNQVPKREDNLTSEGTDVLPEIRASVRTTRKPNISLRHNQTKINTPFQKFDKDDCWNDT